MSVHNIDLQLVVNVLLFFVRQKGCHLCQPIHSALVEIVEKRRKGEKDKEAIPCPIAIVECNQYMNGVDLTDQHLSYHSLTVRKTTKWWKKL